VGIRAVFRLFGLSPRGVRFARGRRWVGWTAWAGSAAAVAALLAWQFSDPPDLQRATRAQPAAAEVQDVVDRSGLARLVEANVRFTRADIRGQNTLLVLVYVQPGGGEGGGSASPDAIPRDLSRSIRSRLSGTAPNGVHQVPAPARIVAGSLPTEATLAQVLVSKYGDGLPLYRRCQILARGGIHLDRATLCDWVSQASWWLRPLHELVLDQSSAMPRCSPTTRRCGLRHWEGLCRFLDDGT
jgi:hypothetical protein